MESKGRLILLLIAGVLVAFAALAVYSHVAQSPSEAPVAATTQTARIIIAKHDLSPGTFIQSLQDLDWGAPPPDETPPPAAAPAASDGTQDTSANPDNAAPAAPAAPTPPKETYLRESSVRLEDFNGSIVRRQLHAGEPVPQSALLRAGEGGLMSAVLDPGMRAVTISVNATSGNGGFVLPGDFVDLVLTRDVSRNITNGRETETRRTVYSKTFIENIRVLAADQTLENADNKALVAKTVTLEVTPKQAQMIAVAAELGKISMALRSAVKVSDEEKKVVNPDEVLSDKDLDMEVKSANPDVTEQVKVFRPKETQNLEFYKQSNDTMGKP